MEDLTYEDLVKALSSHYPVYMKGENGQKRVVLDMAYKAIQYPHIEGDKGGSVYLWIALLLITSSGLDVELYTNRDERGRTLYQFRIIGPGKYHEEAELTILELPKALLKALLEVERGISDD
ncbi:MAG: hypothetical protein QXM12_02825 [Nitrososphaerota archaeon]